MNRVIGEVISLSPSGARIQADDGKHGMWVHRNAFGVRGPHVGDRIEYTPWRSERGEDFALNLKVMTAEQAEVHRALG